MFIISSVQSLSRVQCFVTSWTTGCQASLSITSSLNFFKLMSIELVMPYNHLNLCSPILLLPLIFPSITIFTSESVLHIRGPKNWSFSFNISPSNEYLGLIFFRVDNFDFLLSKRLSTVFSNTTVQNHQFSTLCLLCGPTLTSIHKYWKSHSFD